MREPITEIEARLAQLQVPPDLISVHLKRLEKWRDTHRPKVKRHRLPATVFSANGHALVKRRKRPRR